MTSATAYHYGFHNSRSFILLSVFKKEWQRGREDGKKAKLMVAKFKNKTF